MEQVKRIFLVVLIGLIATPPARAEKSAAADRYGRVELITDSWGVPHVRGETDAGAMYGLGYASARDRGFQMHYMLRVIQGRLAEVIGDVKKTRRDETAVDNDRKMRTFGFARAADRIAGRLDPESAALLEAYCDGVNEYFSRNAGKLHPMFAQTGLQPETWTPADCLLSWWHLAQFFATDGTRDLIQYHNLAEGNSRERMMAAAQAARGSRGGRGGREGGRGASGRGAAAGRQGGARGGPSARGGPAVAELKPLPPDDPASVVQPGDVSQAWIEQTRAFMREHGYHTASGDRTGRRGPAGPKFSHAWVVDGKMSGSGSAVLVSMPQTPVANPSLFYEFHIEGKTFNARGVGVPGSPVILIGFNEKVAWGMTALGSDQADLFRLKTDDDHPDQYRFDGQWRSMKLIEEKIKVKGGRAETLVVRQTHFGPVVTDFAFAREGDPPVALKRIPMCEPDRTTFQGSLAMLRSSNVYEFFDALEGWRFPSANVLFGDSRGEIGYSTAGALPLRSTEALDQGSAAHDGSASKFDWITIIPQQLVPHVFNPAQGYLFSGNHRPIASFYPIPIGTRTFSMGDSLRSLRLRQLLEGRTSLSPQEVRDMHLDSTNAARYAIAKVGYQLRDVLKRDLSAEATLTLAHIEGWYAAGGPSRLDVAGAEVATRINTMFRLVQSDLTMVYGGGESGLSRFVKTVNRRLAGDPKADVSPLEAEFVDHALAYAWNTAQQNYGGNPATWNAQARRAVTERKLGYYVSLDGFPSLDESGDMNVPALLCVDGATVFSQGAQAYVQWVPLADVDTAAALLPPGASEWPDSPTRTADVDRWVKGQLRPAPITRQAVDRVAQSRQTLLP